MQINIVGLGNLGSAMAVIAANNGHQVLGWEYDENVVNSINESNRNETFLAGITLPTAISATTQLEDIFNLPDLVIVTLPSRFIVPVLTKISTSINQSIPIVNMSKGINADTGDTAFQMLSGLFPNNPKAMLAGPSLANEFVRGVLTGLVAATEDQVLLKSISKALNNKRFFITASDDALGVELGGVLKNMYALGMGLFDGRDDIGMNFVGAYLTQALYEMRMLGVAMGAKAESFSSLSGIGDLITTAMSEHSHNRSMGQLVAQGLSIKAIQEKVGVLPEGYNTLKVALQLAQQHQLQLPLAQLLSEVINSQLAVDAFFEQFTARLRSFDVD